MISEQARPTGLMMGKAMLRVCQKTRLCTFNQVGLCNRGSECTFAHGKDELRPVPDLFKTKMCPAVVRRERCEDTMCTYAHDKTELRRTGKASVQAKPEVQAHAALEPLVVLAPVLAAQWQQAPQEDSKKQRRKSKQSSTEFAPAVAGGASADLSQWLPPPPLAGVTGAGPAAAQPAPPQAPAPSPAQGQDAAANSAGTATASASQLKNKFHKTKMCYYFMHGLCNKKRSRCSFAHSEQEMRPLPDLFCTKLCPKVVEGEQCWDLDCKFAHSEQELRSDEKEHENTVEQDEQGSQAAQRMEMDFDTFTWVRHRTEPVVPSKPLREMSVKNTFITIPEDELEPMQRPMRRTQSLPTLDPSGDDSRPSGNGAGSPRPGRAAALQAEAARQGAPATPPLPPSPPSPVQAAGALLGFGDSIRWNDETLNPWSFPAAAGGRHDAGVGPEGQQCGEPPYQQLHAAWALPPPMEPRFSNLADCRNDLHGGGLAGLAEWQAAMRSDMGADCSMGWAPAQGPLRGGIGSELGPHSGA